MSGVSICRNEGPQADLGAPVQPWYATASGVVYPRSMDIHFVKIRFLWQWKYLLLTPFHEIAYAAVGALICQWLFAFLFIMQLFCFQAFLPKMQE